MGYMSKRFWLIIGFIGGLAIAAALLVFVWLPFRQPATISPVTEENVFLQKGGLEAIAGYKKGSTFEVPVQTAPTAQWIFPAFKEPEFKPLFEEEGEKIKETFLEQFSALSKSPVLSPEQALPAKATGTKRLLSDEEWFKITYPDSYLEYLATIEQAMRDEGFISESEKFEFTSDEKIRSFLHKTIDFFLEQGFIDKMQADNFRQGIDVVLPDLQKQEKRLWEEKLNALLLKFVKIAYAQYPLDCFRIGPPLPGGVNLWAPCCDCGYNIVGRRGSLVYIDHCSRVAADIGAEIDIYSPFYDPVTNAMYTGAGGASTGLCAINLGCLNEICRLRGTFLPAIWDPMTGICGCG